MQPIVAQNLTGLDIHYELEPRQRNVMAAAVQQEWFDILQKLMEEEIRLLNVKLINTDGADTESIIANHRIAKGASMFYIGVMKRLDEEITLAKAADSTVGTPYNPERPPSLEEMI